MSLSPDPADLEGCRELRVARRQLARQEEYEALLRRAAFVRRDAGEPADPALVLLIEQAQARRANLQQNVDGRVFPRKRPKASVPRPSDSCLVFLDECGSHHLTSADLFPVFCLAAVITREDRYPALDGQFGAWKARDLPSADFVVHESDIRNRLGPWRGSNRAEILDALRDVLQSLDFTIVASVLRRPEYVAQWGDRPPDPSLPDHPYLMSLDFLFERIVMALEARFDGGKAKVIAESRGPKEDALLQYEFARLHLEGTSYISPSWFRQQLHPGIHFERKGSTYASGLQLADLTARPIAEKVAHPASEPDRWAVVRNKLCPRVETKNSILGLKILPWDPRFTDLWRS